MEPIFVGDVLLTKSCKDRQNGCSTRKQTDFSWRKLWMQSGTISWTTPWCGLAWWGLGLALGGRLATVCWRRKGGVALAISSAPAVFHISGAKRQVSDSGYFRILH